MIRIVIFVLCFVIVNSLYEGDKCTIRKTNSPGICTLFSKCELAQDDLKLRKIIPQTCGFIGASETIVCCPFARSTTTTSTTAKYQKTENRNDEGECDYPSDAITVRRNEYPHKSWNKCIDLADSVFPCSRASFKLDAKKIRLEACGHPPAELIYGGEKARTNEFPHMAALGFKTDQTIRWGCGGTLINEQWIMTAAHCLYSTGLKAYVSKARLGENDLRIAGNPEFLFDIIERVKHPEYVPNLVYNDIALIKIDRPVVYSYQIRPACLHVGNNIDDDKAIASGFGLISTGNKSDVLLKVVLNKFTKEICSSKNPPQKRSPNGVINTQICYGSKTEIKDTCQGDSGGPLQVYNRGVHCTYTVIGVTSVGKICGSVGLPSLYTKVSEYIPWIESVVWPN